MKKEKKRKSLTAFVCQYKDKLSKSGKNCHKSTDPKCSRNKKGRKMGKEEKKDNSET